MDYDTDCLIYHKYYYLISLDLCNRKYIFYIN